ncbi:sigma-70 family RNA polymerase sigma factor [Peribacillus sp. SCS-37]|uniref:sigma-70 family RNA polymerase sigma factor n=1 Tax=Paraperibacillus esterisolvens TaxID=3115296 RepID=UPI003905A620
MEGFTETALLYRPLINKVIRTLRIYKEKDEYFQIGLIALWEAAEKHSSAKGPFLPFAYSVIKGRMLNQLNKERKHEEKYGAEWKEESTSSSAEDYFKDEKFDFLCTHLTDNGIKWLSGVYEGKTIEEISVQWEVTKDSVKSWRKAALKRLRKPEVLDEI